MSDWKLVGLSHDRIGAGGWMRVILRGAALGGLTYGCLVVLMLVRLVEWPIFGMNRPWSPFITQFVCRAAFVIMNIRYETRGQPMALPGAIVANHGSWLDIFTLNAAQRIYFVAKSEVAGWPGIGWLARVTGTVFINRKGSEAKAQQQVFEARLRAGHRLLFFPEGTSTDAIRVLPFKSTLFAAFFAHGLERVLHIQPVTVVYHAPEGQDPRYYGWWGDMDFGGSLLHVLASPKQGRVEVIFHQPVPVDGFGDRKALASYCERVIRTSHPFAPA